MGFSAYLGGLVANMSLIYHSFRGPSGIETASRFDSVADLRDDLWL